VLGTKRTIPFWRARRPLLSLERALAPLRKVVERSAMPTPSLVVARARGRLQAESRKKGRFTEN
jgi:hypothetical protein